MATVRTILPLLLAFVLSPLASTSQAQTDPGTARISDLSYLDRQFMREQRETLDELARTRFGQGFSGRKQDDLPLLQRMLDEQVVRDSQTRELQAMGLILGDLLAQELDMHWVVYEDRLGRSRALRYRDSDNYLFPTTMISRRREAGNKRPVAEIYQKAYDIIAPLRPALPFQ